MKWLLPVLIMGAMRLMKTDALELKDRNSFSYT